MMALFVTNTIQLLSSRVRGAARVTASLRSSALGAFPPIVVGMAGSVVDSVTVAGQLF